MSEILRSEFAFEFNGFSSTRIGVLPPREEVPDIDERLKQASQEAKERVRLFPEQILEWVLVATLGDMMIPKMRVKTRMNASPMLNEPWSPITKIFLVQMARTALNIVEEDTPIGMNVGRGMDEIHVRKYDQTTQKGSEDMICFGRPFTKRYERRDPHYIMQSGQQIFISDASQMETAFDGFFPDRSIRLCGEGDFVDNIVEQLSFRQADNIVRKLDLLRP